ncbi:monooxygenase [Cytophagales bacterium WSM2-2]|nr:monooxygenase [Cytophagales bacterium WSM2-2]
MKEIKTIGIIGAGISGLVAAKTCLEYGYQVKVFEKDREVGGVWSLSRRYPGLSTQNNKDTYFFSDFPMPNHFSEWPTGAEMQLYLNSYAIAFGVFQRIRFSHDVTKINFQDNSWTIEGKAKGIPFTDKFDFIIVSNGTFSDPFIPQLPGTGSFISAGGKILHNTQFHSTALARDKRIVVVGYGKSSSDVVTAASDTAKSTHLVFRAPKWKLPRYIKGINLKYILLNRLGESIIRPENHRGRLDRFLHKLGLPQKMLSFVQSYIIKTQQLKENGLLPPTQLLDEVFGEITLETREFFNRVQKGKIITKQGEIVSFEGKQLTLSTGEKIECDMVIFATGFNQSIPFMSDDLIGKFTDESGNYLLHRHILPPGVPSLAFVGYNTSIFSSLTSEIGALWVCEYLKGRMPVPDDAQIIKEGKEFIAWRSGFRLNASSRGLSVMPSTIYHVDQLLDDMKAPLPLSSLIPDWLVTVNPGRYKQIREKLLRRNKV